MSACRGVQLSLIAVLCLCASGACGLPAAHAGPPVSSTRPGSPQATPSNPSAAGGHVFVIVMENRSYDQAMASSYVAQLARRYAVATNYHAISHPSLPNYLALTSGSTWGIGDDNYHVLPAAGLGSELTTAGISWRAYAEGFNGDCLKSPYPYAVKHNPFAYYGGDCPSNVVAMTQLSDDLAGQTPRLVWLIPGLCNDGHDCSAETADTWLQQTVPEILGSTAWQEGGVLFITWDEDDSGSDNHVATVIVAPTLKAHTSAADYDHYSLLATIEDRLGVPRQGRAVGAHAMTDLID